jgi:hypothetical protein
MTDTPITPTKPRKTVRKGAPPAPGETLGALKQSDAKAAAPAKAPKPVKAPKPARIKAAPKAVALKPIVTKPAKPDVPKKAQKPVSERTKPLNFRVTNEFRKAFKQAATTEDCKKVELLEKIFYAWLATR